MSVISTREEAPQIVRAAVSPRLRPAAPTGGGMTGRDILRILRKRKWLIVLSVLGFAALAALGTYVWMVNWPLYTAEAFLMVSPPQGAEVGGGATMYPREIMDRVVMTQVRFMSRSEFVFSKALEDPNFHVQETNWFRRQRPERRVIELMDAVDIIPVTNTNFIRVSMTGLDANELTTIVNAVARSAVAENTTTTSEENRQMFQRLEDERRDQNTKLSRVRTEINDLQNEQNVTVLTERRQAMGVRLQTLQVKLIEMELARQKAKAAVDELENMKKTNPRLDNTPEGAQLVNSDPSLRSLRFAEMNTENDLKNAVAILGPKHRQVMALAERLKSVRDQLAVTENDLKVAEKVEMARRSEVDRIASEISQVQERFREEDSRARDIQSKLGKIEDLRKQEDEAVTRIRHTEDQQQQLRIITKAGPPVSLRREATIPRERSQPRWAINMPIGSVLGLLIGLALAFLLELVDTSIRGPSDISRRMDVPLLGMIPHSDDLEENIPDMRLAFQSHPNSLIGEAFRQVRTCLMFSGPAERRRSLLVTSALPEDGRGTIVMNLAGSTARSGRRVLVVDTNFRQPMVRKLFPQVPEAGLSSALVGQASWKDLVREVEPNLFIMASGPLPPNPAELLGSEQMRQLIAEMVAQYDQVLFDGSPCLIVADSTILSSLVDGVVIVVRAGANTHGIVQRTRDTLNRVGAHILGVVLNGVRATAGGYLRKSYETFYDYHTQAQLPRGGVSVSSATAPFSTEPAPEVEQSELRIVNRLPGTVMVAISGPESHTFELDPRSTQTLVVAPGKYSFTVDVIGVMPGGSLMTVKGIESYVLQARHRHTRTIGTDS
jgi:succinoglycan biosynthesis transport protein ExoP